MFVEGIDQHGITRVVPTRRMNFFRTGRQTEVGLIFRTGLATLKHGTADSQDVVTLIDIFIHELGLSHHYHKVTSTAQGRFMISS